MQFRSFHITCADGHQMPVYSWLPDTEPRMVIHIAHGMAEYAERYAPIAAMLVLQGIAVYAHDHRAHGKAAVPGQQPGDLGGLGIADNNWFYRQIDDIRLIIQYVRKAHGHKKIFLLGHSMGSFIAQRFFQLHGKEIDGLILSATNGMPDPLLSFGIAVAWLQMTLFGKNYRSRLIDTLSFQQYNRIFAPNRTQHDWLSRDEKEVDLYAASIQCGFVCNATFFYYFFKGLKDIFRKENIRNIPKDIPVYAFAGDKDPVGGFGKGFLQLVGKWKAAGVKDIEYKLYPNGRHESLNEINREEVLNDLVQWLERQKC